MRAKSVRIDRTIRVVEPIFSQQRDMFVIAKDVTANGEEGLKLQAISNCPRYPVDSEKQCHHINLLRLDHLSKTGTDIFSQIWMEWVVSHEEHGQVVVEEDQVPIVTSGKLQAMALAYPKFPAYLLHLRPLEHLVGIAYRIDSSSAYTYILREQFVTRLIEQYKQT